MTCGGIPTRSLRELTQRLCCDAAVGPRMQRCAGTVDHARAQRPVQRASTWITARVMWGRLAAWLEPIVGEEMRGPRTRRRRGVGGGHHPRRSETSATRGPRRERDPPCPPRRYSAAAAPCGVSEGRDSFFEAECE